jgi:ribose/xylose/arabinose/galactoside ABC-type transport system permease subunit
VKTNSRALTFSRELGLVILTIALLIIFRILFPVSWERFATFDNLSSVVRNMVFEGFWPWA